MSGRKRACFGAVMRWSVVWLLAVLLVAPLRAVCAQPAPGEQPGEAPLAAARRHFELGVVHYDRNEWQAALVEFLMSRELAPTRSNTKNAAICLRKVGRFDEALDLFEALLRDYPDLPAADRELAERELAELRASVGTIELRDAPPGARVSVDGVDRGTTPLSAPLRLPAGTHTLRVVKDGALPFETRVDLAGGRSEVVRVELAALTRAGRLRISEKNGRRVEVLIDGSPVGMAPWDGALAPGEHGVSLRGEGALGTPPSRVSIEVGKAVALELEAVELNAELEVRARPESAEIVLDGVRVSRGAWRGRLATGSHRLAVTLAGYEPFARALTLEEGEREVVVANLEPAASKARIALELEAGVPLGLVWGGDLDATCDASCSSSLPLGIYAQGHAAYQFSSGVGLGIHAGYFRSWKTFRDRPETVDPTGSALHRGRADDLVRVAGIMAGAEAEYAFGAVWPVTLRIGAGALLGAVTDTRTGQFEDSSFARYSTGAQQIPRASYFSLSPEVRIGRRVTEHFEASFGAKLLVLTALDRPAWDSDEPESFVFAGVDRGGVFPSADLTGAVVLMLLPSAALRYAF